MVESALVLLLFVVTLIGTFDVAQFLFYHQSLTERVRGAARYAAVNTFDTTAVQNMVLYNQSTAPSGRNPDFNLTSSMISVQRYDTNTPEDRVVVTVSNYPFLFITPFIAGWAHGMTITACNSYEPQ